ncbi:winged helix-turn-helix transcriptional regulator [Paraburkholderia sediminicola]|uniref:winged helix-turn-helix transcriptional regulator n=1 Tax=Paraburkholderia sediminicola TaxID=458836 RepID=UPI0038BBE360
MRERCIKNSHDFDRLLRDKIADRWTILLLCAICGRDGSLHSNALRREIDGISQKTLTECLRRLERNGFVGRHMIKGASPGVEYATGG